MTMTIETLPTGGDLRAIAERNPNNPDVAIALSALRTIIKQVERTRMMQTNYFRIQTTANLRAAKAEETTLKRMIDRLKTTSVNIEQFDLFED